MSISESGSGIARIVPCRRALNKEFRRKILFPKYASAHLSWSAFVLRAFKKRCKEGGGADRMVILLTVLTARIIRLDVGGRRSQPHVSLSVSRCATATGRRASAFRKCVVTSLRNTVSLE